MQVTEFPEHRLHPKEMKGLAESLRGVVVTTSPTLVERFGLRYATFRLLSQGAQVLAKFAGMDVNIQILLFTEYGVEDAHFNDHGVLCQKNQPSKFMDC